MRKSSLAMLAQLKKAKQFQEVWEASIQPEIPSDSDRLEDPSKKKKKKDRKGPLIIDLA